MKTEYIPIGMNCSVTFCIKNKKLRTQAYPFDWQITSTKSFWEACSNNFDGLLEDIWIGPGIERYYIVENVQDPKVSNELIYPVICKTYNILFPHYCLGTSHEDIQSVRVKMRKRIDTFNSVINDNNIHKKFVYTFASLNEWQKSCYNAAGTDLNMFSKKAYTEYLNKAVRLFSNQNIKFANKTEL